MRTPQLHLLSTAVVTLAGCNPFHRDPAVQVRRDENQNTRWTATLATPAGLAGAVQIRGSARMMPDGNAEKTRVFVDVSNATPGGLHPWQLHRGQCGTDEGLIGDASQYKPVKVNGEGQAAGTATVSLATPTTGSYYVSVGASGANAETIVACGNLAPPTS